MATNAGRFGGEMGWRGGREGGGGGGGGGCGDEIRTDRV